MYGAPPQRGTGQFGYMLQRDELFPWRTVERNIRLPLEIGRDARAAVCGAGARARRKVRAGADFLKQYPGQLSGGMRQRAALIRTLAADPDILLLDEPFSALDYQTRLNVCGDVCRIIRSEKKTALLVTHDISEAISAADRVLVLSARPARVVAAHALGFGDAPPLQRREDARFAGWFERLWKELNG